MVHPSTTQRASESEVAPITETLGHRLAIHIVDAKHGTPVNFGCEILKINGEYIFVRFSDGSVIWLCASSYADSEELVTGSRYEFTCSVDREKLGVPTLSLESFQTSPTHYVE